MVLRGQRVAGALSQTLQGYYARLLKELGPQGWWPARTRLEVILGAVLTQNTSWQNAAEALKRLRQVRRLSLPGLRRTSQSDLESLVRPAGFFRQKALAIRHFLEYLEGSHQGSLPRLLARPAEELRHDLLGLKGFGPETVDAILVYAARRPYFVADAYTRRILARHELVSPTAGYGEVQAFLHQHLPSDHELFNEYHALLVEVGKRYCKRQKPQCEGCPLEEFLPAPNQTVETRHRGKGKRASGENVVAFAQFPFSPPSSQ
jgi:endonuclease-3 related protein